MKFVKWIVLLLFIIAGVAIIWWTQAPSAKQLRKQAENLKPYVNIVSLSVGDINNEIIKMTGKLRVSNPYPVDIHATQLNYQVYLDTVLVIEEVYKKAITIRSSDTIDIDLPMNIRAAAMSRALAYMGGNKEDSATYHLKANLLVDLPVAGSKKFDFNMSRRMPVMRMPELTIERLNYDLLNVSEEGLNFQVLIKNGNGFPVTVSEGRFTFSVEGTSVRGRLAGPVQLPAHGQKRVKMHAGLSEVNLPELAMKWMKRTDAGKYNFAFTGQLQSGNKLLDNSSISLNRSGRVEDLVKR